MERGAGVRPRRRPVGSRSRPCSTPRAAGRGSLRRSTCSSRLITGQRLQRRHNAGVERPPPLLEEAAWATSCVKACLKV